MTKFFVADPFNNKDIELFKSLDSDNIKISTMLSNIKKTTTKEEYLKCQSETNEQIEILYTLDKDSIKNYCCINGEKDIKSGTIIFPSNTNITKSFITSSTDYALDNMGLETVFIKTTPDNKYLNKILKELGYENLGEELGTEIYMTEKQYDKEEVYNGTNKKH